MNDPQAMPSLESPAAAELPVRVLRAPYFILRTPIGGFYLDTEWNERLVKNPVNALSLFLADAQRVAAPGSELGEARYQARENLRPLRYLHEGALKDFAEATSAFYKGGVTSAQVTQRQNFRLPDPGKEPDAYWVYGDRFAPRLLILWGCEKEQGSSLPLIGDGRSVVKELRAKAMSWTRLFREGVELSRLKDPLKDYIAFPVLSAEGKLTHVDRLVNGQYVREEVHLGGGKSWKVRPLKRLPGGAILQFRKTAAEFYRKAHRSDCACVRCAPGAAAPSSPAGHAPVPALSYEQELRRGFRLPDPELRPDAYFVAGRPLSEQLLILCPNPGIKDAEEIAQEKKDFEWAEDKARTPEDKERARTLREKYEQDLATHNLYKRYFYEEQECLPLTDDEELGLPAPVAKPSGEPGAVPAPTGAAPKAKAQASEETVAGKLKSIDWAKLGKKWGAIVGVIIAGIVAAYVSWPKHLLVAGAAMSNDATLDPENRRNVVEVEFNNRLAPNKKGDTNQVGVPPALYGQYSLHFNGNELKLRAPAINSTNQKRLTLTIDLPGVTLSEDGKYTLYIEKARDVWHNNLAATNVAVKVVDLRAPSFLGKVLPAPDAADARDSIQFDFDEPLDKANAETAGNYAIAGLTIKSAQLMENRQTVVLKADKPFESGTTYQLTLSTNITDAAHAKNRLRPSSANFTYVQIPLRLESVSARDSQLRIKMVFNQAYDMNSAKTALKVGNLKVGSVQALDSRALEVVLTNSYMTNGTYNVQITGLKDTSGKPGSELTTNCAFAYEGQIETTPPVLGDLSATATRLELTFSKDLREESATREDNYVLYAQNGGAWEKSGVRFHAELAPGGNRVVALNFLSSLPIGRLRLQYAGVEDLYGNSTNGMKEFSAGIVYPFKAVKAAQILNQERTAIQFTLSPKVDKICEKPANFQLEDTQGTVIQGVDISKVTLTTGNSSTEVRLDLSKGLTRDKFQVRFLKLREEGQAWEQTGVATTGQ